MRGRTKALRNREKIPKSRDKNVKSFEAKPHIKLIQTPTKPVCSVVSSIWELREKNLEEYAKKVGR